MNLKEIRKRIQGKYFSLYGHYLLHIILVCQIYGEIVEIIAEGADTGSEIYYSADDKLNLDYGCLDNLVRITKGEFVKRINEIKNAYDAKRSEKTVSG